MGHMMSAKLDRESASATPKAAAGKLRLASAAAAAFGGRPVPTDQLGAAPRGGRPRVVGWRWVGVARSSSGLAPVVRSGIRIWVWVRFCGVWVGLWIRSELD